MEKKLYVGNLSYQATRDELEELFAPYGRIADVFIATDRETGRPRGFAFVEYAEGQHALDAIEALHDSEFLGRRLTVNIARPKNRPGGGGGGGGRGRYDR